MKNKYQITYWFWQVFILLLVLSIILISASQTPPSPKGQLADFIARTAQFFWIYTIFNFQLHSLNNSSLINSKLKNTYPQIESWEEENRTKNMKNLGISIKIALVPFIAIGIIFLWLHFTHQNSLKIIPTILFEFWFSVIYIESTIVEKKQASIFFKNIDQLLSQQPTKIKKGGRTPLPKRFTLN
jgi:hypothetical protein